MRDKTHKYDPSMRNKNHGEGEQSDLHISMRNKTHNGSDYREGGRNLSIKAIELSLERVCWSRRFGVFVREGTIWKRSKPASIELSMAAVVKTRVYSI